MRIVTWNCNGGFWRKFSKLSEFSADVLVVQECNDPARSNDKTYRAWAGENYAWIGPTATKGLGIFVRNGLTHTTSPVIPAARFFLPIRLGEIPICGVWAHKDAQGSRHYCGQTHTYLSAAPDWLADPLAILLGDFNSSSVWDRPKRLWNHSDSVQILHDHGLRSAYHETHQARQGSEPHPSFLLHRNRSKPYHIDYLFHGRGWTATDCKIGAPDQWLTDSDHMPIFVELSRNGSLFLNNT